MSFSSDYTANSLKAELNARGWRMTPQRSMMGAGISESSSRQAPSVLKNCLIY